VGIAAELRAKSTRGDRALDQEFELLKERVEKLEGKKAHKAAGGLKRSIRRASKSRLKVRLAAGLPPTSSAPEGGCSHDWLPTSKVALGEHTRALRARLNRPGMACHVGIWWSRMTWRLS